MSNIEKLSVAEQRLQNPLRYDKFGVPFRQPDIESRRGDMLTFLSEKQMESQRSALLRDLQASQRGEHDFFSNRMGISGFVRRRYQHEDGLVPQGANEDISRRQPNGMIATVLRFGAADKVKRFVRSKYMWILVLVVLSNVRRVVFIARSLWFHEASSEVTDDVAEL